jgi:hypothetical protein
MMMVPGAANMPPTRWGTKIWRRDLGGGDAAHLARSVEAIA